MGKIDKAIYEIHRIDDLASKDQWVNKLHPLVKFVLTVYYIVLVVSFNRYDLVGLCGMVIYPLVLFVVSELSFFEAIKRLRVVLPLVIFIGIFNPIFDKAPVVYMGWETTTGVISMITLILKGTMAVLASYLLIATTKVEQICYAMRLIHIPKILVTEFLLIYRYIALLLEEVNRITKAYSLRAPNQKGVHYKVWGSLTGQLLIRSMDRAEIVYESMTLRGYDGEFNLDENQKGLELSDLFHLILWIFLLTLFRIEPMIIIVGNIFS